MRSSTRLLALVVAAALGACADRNEPVPPEVGHLPFQPPELGGRGRPVLSFVNGDFEAGSTAGWTLSTYLNQGLRVSNPTVRTDLQLQTGGRALTSVKSAPPESLLAAGVAAEATLFIPKYHTHAVAVNELGDTNNVNGIKQSMVVTNEDVDPNDNKVHVRFALAAVLENPGHTARQQPYFWATLTNVTRGNAVLFYTFNYANQPGVAWKSTTDPLDGDPVLYTDWQSVDIAPGAAQLAVGDTVELEIIAAGCSLGGHYGHVYLDGIGAYLPGLGVTATAPASVNRNTTLTYTYRYSNNGIDPAPNTVVTVPLPTGTTFASLSAPGASCTTPLAGATGTVTCNLGTLNPATSATFSVTVNATAAVGSTIAHGNYTIAATQVSPLTGPLVNTTVTSGVTYADLATTATDGVAAVGWGSTTTYTVTVRNQGPSAASGATIAIPVPANVSAFTAWSCAGSGGATCGAASGSGAIATTANLPSGGQVTYTVTAAVAAGSGASTIALQATATTPASVTDNATSNNVAVDHDQVGTLRSLTVTKAGTGSGTVLSSPAAIACGAACASQSAAFVDGASVVLTASTAAGHRFLSWTAGPCAGSQSPTCTVPLTADTTVTADFMAGDWLVTGTAPGGHGAVSCQSPRLNGQSSTCAVVPAARYRLTALTDNGLDVLGAVAAGSYAIASVTADHDVVATFGANASSTSVDAAPASPSTLGQSVTFTATAAGVTPAGVPTGTVDFYAGATPLCLGVALSAGQASCATSALAVGGHLVTAVSSGDATWPGATSPALDFTVDQGTATLALDATPGTPTFGQPVTLTATATGPAGAAEPGGTVTFRVDGVAIPGCVGLPLVAGAVTCVTTALPAGSPAITVDYGGDASYLAASTAATLGLTVDKAPAAVTLGALAQTYDGAANPVSVSTSPGGLAVVVTYDGSTTPPTAPGTYAVVATIVDPSYQGSATGTLVVAKADAGITLAGLAQTYSGGPLAASATTAPPGLAVTFTYDGSPTPPTAPGSYTVVATVVDPNYQGTATGTLVVDKATATVTLGSLAQTYDGSARAASATTTPAGLTVTFTYDGSATAPLNAGSYAVVATIQDANYQGSATGTLVVDKATATVVLGSLAQTYTGAARTASATTTPAGLTVTFTYDGGAAAPVNAGSYAVVGTIQDANYQGSASGTLVVDKATAPVTLGSLAQTYDGTPRAVTATTTPAGLTVTFNYDGGATAPTNAGSYAVVGTVQDANYQGSASGTLVVDKATAGLSATLGSLSQTYDGTPRAVTATTTPAGLTVTFTYDGGATPPTNAGSYTVVGTVQDPNYSGTFTATLVVDKATATVVLGSLAQTYTGAARTASATTTPAGLSVTFTYDGGAAAPINAGSYAVVGTIQDANYQGSASGTLVVDKATATVVLGSLAQTYDGSPRTATATTTPAGLTVTFTYDGGASAPLNAGSYAVVGTIQDANYQGSASGTLVVDKATAAVTLAGLAQVYTGTPRSALVGTTPAGLSVSLTYDGSATPPTDAGSYAVVATVQDANYQGAATGTLVVDKATASLTLGNLTQTYSGTPRVAIATTTPAGLTVAFTYDGGATAPTGTGSYAVVATIQDANYQGSASGTLVVNKATATVALGSLAQTYDGTPRTATATTTPAGLTVTYTYDGGATAPINAGSYAVVGTVQDANYQGSATGTLVVDKATATVTLGSLAQTYTGAARTASATTTPAGLTVTFTYDGGAAAPVNAGSYAVVGTIQDANHQGSASGTLVVDKATAAVTLGALTQVYTGSPRAALAGTTPAGLTVDLTYDGSPAAPFDAGSYAVVATVRAPNHQGTASGTLVITQATATVTLGNLTQTYDGTPRAAIATTTPPGLTVAFTYDGSPTPPVHAGSVTVVGTIQDPNYQGAATGTLVIGKATATVLLDGLSQPYTGAPRVVGATTIPPGLAVVVTYAGSTTAPSGVGTYAVVATVDDPDYQGSATGQLEIAQALPVVTLESSANPSVFLQTVVLTATVTGGAAVPGGSVTFSDGATTLCTAPLALVNGRVSCATSALAVGTRTITASYGGDATYQAADGTLAQTVGAAATTTTLTASTPSPTYGAAMTLTATVTAVAPGGGTPAGTVAFAEGATLHCPAAPVTGGVATCLLPATLAAAPHTFSAAFQGSAQHLASTSAPLSRTVAKAAATVQVVTSQTPSTYGTPVTFTATVRGPAGAPTGSVTFTDGPNPLCADVALDAGGVARCTSGALTSGNHFVTAAYGGDANHDGGTAFTQQFIDPTTASLSASATPNPATFGEVVTLTATVTGAGVTPTGQVVFTEGGAPLCSGSLDAGGVARCASAPLPVGDHPVTAQYVGDGNYQGATTGFTLTIGPAPVTVAVTSSANPAVYGASVTLTATVAGPGGTPGGAVTFRDGTTVLCGGPRPLAAGQATCPLVGASSLAVGSHPVTATYDGVGNYQGGVSAPLDQVMTAATPTLDLASAPNPSVFGTSVTFTATVGGAGLPPTGSVTFTAGALALCGPATVSGGVASCSASTLPQGLHTVTASYGGDANYVAAQAGRTHVVTQATAVTTLTASPASSVFGQEVTLTVRVGGVPGAPVAPSGTVTLLEGSAELCGGPLQLEGGVATCHKADFSAAAHELAALFSGDANYLPGAPAGLRYTVSRAATEVALAVSPVAAVHGEPLVFSATVTPVAPGAGQPSGPVDFYADDLVVGSGEVDPATGVATFTLLPGQALPAGDHLFMATYQGDASFEGSVSPTLPAYTIGQAASLVSITSTRSPSVFGEEITFTVEVLPLAPGGGTADGVVSVAVGGAAPFELPLVGGAATFSTSALPVGSTAIDAVYPGDPNFLPSAGHADQLVERSGAVVSGVVDVEPSAYGQRVAVTATVRAAGPGGGTPTGTVSLLRDGAPVATGQLDPTGSARLTIATLPVGTTTLTLAYDGDGNFLAGQGTLDHLVLPAVPEVTLEVSALEPVYGEPLAVSAAVTPPFFTVGAPTGRLLFLDGATVIREELLDVFGRAAFTVEDLAPGAHALKAVYLGDGSFLDAESLPLEPLVRPASINIGLSVVPSPSVYGEQVTWSVQAVAASPSLATPTGLVDIWEGGAVLATLQLDGTGPASGPAPTLEVGAHLLTARFRDDVRFVALNSASLTQRVAEAPTAVAVTASPSPSVFGAPVTLRAQVSILPPASGLPTGLVAFLVDGLAVGEGTLDAAGEAVLDAAALSTGPHEVVARYLGDGHAAPQDSAPLPHLVSPADTTAALAVAPATAAFGQQVDFSATVTSSAGTPGGQVDLLERGVVIGSAVLDAQGKARFATSALPVGTHAVAVGYLGDTDHRASTSAEVSVQVVPASTTTALEASLAAAVTGQPVTLTATVTPVAPGAGAPAGLVTFLDGAVELGTAAVDAASHQARLVVTSLAVGPHALTAAFQGEPRFDPSTSAPPVAVQVDPADVAVTVTTTPAGSTLGEPVTVTVTVAAAAPGGGTPTGEVALADGASPLGAITLTGGIGTRVVTLPAGPHTLVATYPGDPGYRGGRGEAQHVVARAASTTTLATSGSPSLFGQPITLTATVAPGLQGFGEPGGVVTFKDGEALIGTAAVGPGGLASLAWTPPGGLRSLTAAYGGDLSFAPSVGAATQEVRPAAVAIEVTASPAVAQFGQPVTLTVTVTSPTPGAGVPTGTVTVHDGLTLVGTFPLVGGVASVTLDALTVGTHPLTITLAATPAFDAASASTTVQVDEAAVRLTLASSRQPSRAGRPVTFTVRAEADHATPIGTVTLKNGSAPLGTAPLVDGVATFTTRTLPKGTHAITAQLPAAGGFGAATASLSGGQRVENSAPVAGSGSALRLGPAGAALAEGAADGRLDAAEGTVELWARTGWTRTDQVGAAPLLARLGDDAAPRWALGVTPARTGLTLALGAAPTVTVPADLSDGGWHQVALVASGGAVTVLLDGVEVGAVDGAFGDVVGRRLTVGDGFVGEVDELRVWSTPRTAAALAADARRPLRGDEEGLRGCWRMDEPDVAEAFDAGPAAVDLVARPAEGLAATDTHVASGAWRHRVARRERALTPIDAGYDADGDRLRLAVTAPPLHGTATADPVALQVGYLGEPLYLGDDQLTFRLTDEEDATGEFTVDLTVERILACQVDADCSGGDLCAQGTCVAPSEFQVRAGGCGCSSSGGGALALWSLLALGLAAPRRGGRTRRPGAVDGRRP